MIQKYFGPDKTYSFVNSNEKTNSHDNIYTVLIGKNGTGKSRLLKSLIENFMGPTNHNGFYSSKRKEFIDTGKVEATDVPKNIIAISTSPFDKFPIYNYREVEDERYSYLGLRNLNSSDLGKAYMSNIFLSLITSIIRDNQDIQKILNVLNYLGYEKNLQANYRLEINRIKMREVFDSSNPVETFINIFLRKRTSSAIRINLNFFKINGRDDEAEFDTGKVEFFLELYSRYFLYTKGRIVTIGISASGIDINLDGIDFLNEFLFLLETRIFRLTNILIRKCGSYDVLDIGEASSGEQSVVMSILGIASKIKNKSLVCIDEPEVCLHPEWQEKYINILMKTFKDYSGCHFIIATHSPLIVSSLADDNCFILSMANATIKNASEINKKSVDFQLANVFDTPGFKNEYLMREFITILTMFGANEQIDDLQIRTIKDLLKLKEVLSDKDPVKKLMIMAEEILEENFNDT
mgnify:CR=1 FL=1